jgi:hypothetical protein
LGRWVSGSLGFEIPSECVAAPPMLLRLTLDGCCPCHACCFCCRSFRSL